MVASLLIAGIGYTFLGLQEHPFEPAGIAGAVLVGIGQMSVILSSTALMGQETPVDSRGAVIGLAGFCGALDGQVYMTLTQYFGLHIAQIEPSAHSGRGRKEVRRR